MLVQFDLHAFLLSSISAQAMIPTLILVRLVYRKQTHLQYISDIFSTGATFSIPLVFMLEDSGYRRVVALSPKSVLHTFFVRTHTW